MQGYPTVKFFGPDKSNPTDFGGRTASDFVEFAANNGGAAPVAVPRPLTEVFDQASFADACLGDGDEVKPPVVSLVNLPANVLIL